MLRKSLAGFVLAQVAILVLVLQPYAALAQQISIDPNAPRAQQPGIGRSATGKPVINIVKPNAGVSRNRFRTLSTDSGLIFNNSATAGTSRTGGKVDANPNLRSGTAKVILNEVRGTTASTLKGPLEIHGSKADVIIANENGVTCNGCAFVNTGIATLSSGRARVSGGDVSLEVRKGGVSVGRGGITGADIVNLTGRHVIIDGKVVANRAINVSGGAQTFDPATGRSKAAPSDVARDAPFAVDSTAFGALNAGTIRVVGNESGLGVRLRGNVNASSDLAVASRGDTTVRNFKAGRDARISAGRTLRQMKGAATVGRNLTLSARDITTDAGATIAVAGAANLRVSSTVTVAGEIRARAIIVTAPKSALNMGRVIAREGLSVVAGEITNRRSVTQTTKKTTTGPWARYVPFMTNYLRMYPRGWLSDYYRMLIASSTRTVNDQQTMGAAALVQAHDISLNATKGGITNESHIVAGRNLTLLAATDIASRRQVERDRQANGTYRTRHHAALLRADNIYATAGRNVANAAILDPKGTLSVRAKTGSITGIGTLDVAGSVALVSAGAIDRRDPITAKGSIALTSTRGTLGVSGALVSGVDTKLYARTDLTIAAPVTAGRDVVLTARGGSLNNSSAVRAKRNIAVSAARDVNNLLIDATGATTVKAGGSVRNRYALYGRSALNVTAGGAIVNQGYRTRYSYIYGGRGLNLTAGDNIENLGGRIWTHRDGLLSAGGSIINTGTEWRSTSQTYAGRPRAVETFTTNDVGGWRAGLIEAKSIGNLTLSAGADIRNVGSVLRSDAGSLTLSARRDIVLSAKDYSDRRSVRTRRWYSYRTGWFWNRKTKWAYRDSVANSIGTRRIAQSELSAGRDLALLASRDVSATGRATIGRDVAVHGRNATISILGGLRAASGTARLDATSTLTLNGGTTLARNYDFGRTPHVFLNTQLRRVGQRDVDFTFWRHVTNRGRLTSAGDIRLASLRGSVANTGTLIGRDVTLASANGAVTNTGTLTARRKATLESRRNVTTRFLRAPRIELRSTEGSIAARGALLGGTDVTALAAQNLSLRGVLAPNVTLGARDGDLVASRFTAADGTDAQTGRVAFADQLVTVMDGAITREEARGRTDAVIHATDTMAISVGRTLRLSNGMTLSSAGDLSIAAGEDIVVESAWTNAAVPTASSDAPSLLRDVVQARPVGIFGLLLNGSNGTGQKNLYRSAIMAGGDLSLSARDITNRGGTISAGANLFLNARRTVRNESIRTTFRLTAEHGCEGRSCGRDGFTFAPAEIMAGQGLVMTAGGSVVNRAGQIAAAGSLSIHAGASILNDAQHATYQIVDIYKKKKFLFVTTGKTIRKEYQVALESGVIQTEYGDIDLRADRGIVRNYGSVVSAGGDLSIDAGSDVVLNALSVEVKNLSKKRGFSGFLTYSSNKAYWNEFATSLSALEAGGSVAVSAGRDVKGIGATIMALDDVSLGAGRDIAFDAKQNQKYLVEKGWSFGITASGFDLTGAILSGDPKNVLQAYMADNPMIAAVHELATAEDRWDVVNGSLALLWHGSATIGDANRSYRATGGTSSIGRSLADQFVPSDWQNLRNLRQACGRGANGFDLKSCAAAAGIGFRFDMWQSKQTWTESYVSRIGAGSDLVMTAERDIALAGGTIASAGEDVIVTAGRDFMMTAVADNTRTTSSSWGFGVTLNPGGRDGIGLTVSANASGSRGKQTIYTNGSLTAGGTISLVTGRDANFLGAVVKANDIYFDIGRDLRVASRQNTSSNSSWGFNASVTFQGTTPTGFNIGGSYGRGRRAYTDTPTWIEAEGVVDIYVGRATYLMGAVLASRSNQLRLDTAEFVFDNFSDRDYSVGGNLSAGIGQGGWSASGGFNYSNRAGITYATVSGGEVRVRNRPGINLRALNNNLDTVQRVTDETYINLRIPGLNLATLRDNLEETGNFIRAVTADVPDHVKAQGDAATRIYRRMIANGMSSRDARALAATPEFREAARLNGVLAEAKQRFGEGNVPQELFLAAIMGENIVYTELEDGTFETKIGIVCPVFGTRCEIALSDLKRLLENPEYKERLYSKLNDMLGFFAGALSRDMVNDPELHARWYQPTDADYMANLMGTLLWCARNDPRYFAEAMALDSNVRRYFAEQAFGSMGNLNDFLHHVAANGYSEEAAGEAYAQYVGRATRFLNALTMTALIEPADFAGTVASAIAADGEEREAIRLLFEAIEEDPSGFLAEVGEEIYRQFEADIRNGDYASALGRLSGTAIDVILGSRGTTRTAGALDGVIARAGSRACSFHGDTLVATQRGYTAIRDIVPGVHRVWSRDERTGRTAWKPVTAQYSNPYEETVRVAIRDVETGLGQTIVSNRIHPYFVRVRPTSDLLLTGGADVPPSSEGHVYRGPIAGGRWVDAANLKPGFELLDDDGTWSRVESVEIAAEELRAYNLTVADFHTYFVAANADAPAVWVHNDCPTLGPIDWSGTDPRFPSRRDHVRAHGVDDPSKSVHGVFNSNPIHVTQQAWEIARRNGIQPVVDGNRWVYDIPFPNAGWEGGRNGTGGRLNTVRIVTEAGSRTIVTSFPTR